MTGYTEFRQRLYRPRLPLLWWLRRRSYLVFVVRELTSVFVAWSVAFTLLAVHAILEGADAYRRFLDWSAAPWLIVVNAIALVFVVFHTVTWFNLTPQAVVVRVRGRRVPDVGIAAPLYLAWLVLSALVVWIVLG
jgi:succinate dehydrogenase subunit C